MSFEDANRNPDSPKSSLSGPERVSKQEKAQALGTLLSRFIMSSVDPTHEELASLSLPVLAHLTSSAISQGLPVINPPSLNVASNLLPVAMNQPHSNTSHSLPSTLNANISNSTHHISSSGFKKRRRTDGECAGGRAKLTLKDKFDILHFWDQFPDQQNFAAIGRKYNVSRQTIRKVIQNREMILQDYHNGVPHDAKRCRVLPPDMARLDEMVLEYINSLPTPSSNMKRNVLPISMEALKAKATEIATSLRIKINKVRSCFLFGKRKI